MGIDILIFAGVAVFLLFRLKDILGRSGEGRDKLDHPFETLRDKKERDRAVDAQDFDPHASNGTGVADNVVPINGQGASVEVWHEDPEIDGVLHEIQKSDRSFHPRSFMKGAEAAYEMVLNGFAKGDLNELRGLMSSAVFEDFKTEIDRRADAGESLETTLIGFDEIKIVGASVEDKTAEIDLLYTTQQINVMRDADGASLSDEDPIVETQMDEWTLVRKLTSRDPNWTLMSLTEVDPEDLVTGKAE